MGYGWMLHQHMEDELLNDRSLGALVYLIQQGREFEFFYNGILCFISCSESDKEVSLWIDKTEYAFDNVTQLIEYKAFEDKSLLEIWNDVVFETLF
ncbi:MAG: hypothetical protein E7415_06985 [Ruminococcaceae bacterium]|nr:hypothetical protein [Oscillospiraceae bacterium]